MKRLHNISLSIVLIVAMVTTLAGCWDRRELEDQFFVYTAGVDRSPNNPELLTLSLSAPTIEEDAKEPNQRIVSQGKSLEHASTSARSKLYRDLTFGHIEILMFGQTTAREGIATYLDYFDRNPLVKGTLILAVTEDPSDEFLMNLNTTQHPHIGIFLRELVMGSEAEGISTATTMREFYRTLNMDGKDPSLPFLIPAKDHETVVACHMGVFRDDQFVGMLHKEDSIAVTLMQGNMKRAHLSARIPDKSDVADTGFPDSLSVEVLNGKNRIKTQIVNERVMIRIETSLDVRITEHSPSLRTVQRGTTERLAEILEGQIESDFISALKKLQELQADVIGFGEIVRTKHPQFFEKDRWRVDFADADFDVHVTVTFKRAGRIA